MWIWEADFSRTGWRIASLDNPKIWPECTIIMHWKSQFISNKDTFLVESFKLKIVFSLNSPHHFCAYPGTSRGAKTFLFPRWSKEEPGDPVPKDDRQLKGFPGVKNDQVEMHKYMGKAEQGSHLPISSSSGGSQGRRWHWWQTNRGHGQEGRGRRVFTFSWANLSIACKTHNYHGITCITFCVYPDSYLI